MWQAGGERLLARFFLSQHFLDDGLGSLAGGIREVADSDTLIAAARARFHVHSQQESVFPLLVEPAEVDAGNIGDV